MVEAAQRIRHLGDPGEENARICEKCDCRVEEVILEHDGLEVHLDSSGLVLLGAPNALTRSRKRFEQHRRRSTASKLCTESLIKSSVCGFVDWVAHLVNEEVAALRGSLTDVVASVPNSLEVDFWPIVEL